MIYTDDITDPDVIIIITKENPKTLARVWLRSAWVFVLLDGKWTLGQQFTLGIGKKMLSW